MKSVVRLLLTVLALSMAAFVSNASAQEGGKKGGRGKGGLTVEAIENAVGTLTADQKTKIEGIIAKQREDMQAAGQDAEKRREVGQKARADIRAVLTPEQQTKFDAMPMGRGGKKKKDN